MNDIWEARRVKLQDAAKDAALALLGHMNGASQAKIPVHGRTDATYIVVAFEKV